MDKKSKAKKQKPAEPVVDKFTRMVLLSRQRGVRVRYREASDDFIFLFKKLEGAVHTESVMALSKEATRMAISMVIDICKKNKIDITKETKINANPSLTARA